MLWTRSKPFMPTMRLTIAKTGLPVVFWATLDFQPVPGCDRWMLPNGRPFDWKLNEHCLLLVGYDEDNYWFNDPWHNHGVCPQPKALVEECHRAQGMYAFTRGWRFRCRGPRSSWPRRSS